MIQGFIDYFQLYLEIDLVNAVQCSPSLETLSSSTIKTIRKEQAWVNILSNGNFQNRKLSTNISICDVGDFYKCTSNSCQARNDTFLHLLFDIYITQRYPLKITYFGTYGNSL